jgi:hypothetical protein
LEWQPKGQFILPAGLHNYRRGSYLNNANQGGVVMLATKIIPDGDGGLKDIAKAMSGMDKIIEKFESLQKKKLGFVRYTVRGSKDECAVDAHTSTGLLIKTKMSHSTEQLVKDFIYKYSVYLNSL